MPRGSPILQAHLQSELGHAFEGLEASVVSSSLAERRLAALVPA